MPADYIPLPTTMVTDEPLASVCLNRHWFRILNAMVYPFQYPERWGGTLEENRFAREQVRQLLALLQKTEECGSMTTCCTPPETNVIVRVNADFSISVSTDGGTTYKPSVTDPRYGQLQLPPPGAGADKCQCAEGYIVGMQEWVGKMHEALGHTEALGDFLIELVEGALEVVLILLTIDPTKATAIVGLVGAILKQWYGTPQADWDALWTEEVYDAIRCIIFCNLEDDGQFDESGYENALAQFLAGDIPGGTDPKGAALNAQNMFKFWQLKGVNTMIAANKKPTTFDCDECDCGGVCGADWTAFGFGTETDRGTHPPGTFILGGSVDVSNAQWIEYDSDPTSVGPPDHAVTIHSPSSASCCSVFWEVTSGSVATHAKGDCGSPNDPPSWDFVVLQGDLCNAHEFGDSAPFHVRVTFVTP
jgi:hypothetical protein